MKPLRIGSRGSILARWQAEFVRKQLFQLTGVEAEIIIVKTTGDKLQQSPLTQIGGKGIFIKELEEALLEESVDLAVHSVKDIPTETPGRLHFPAVCRRDDVRDCLVSHTGTTLANLKQGARVGTSSLRRQAQIMAARPDLRIEPLRGNVDTRLRRLDAGEMDAIVLACAGLIRLGLESRITARLDPMISLPAVAQGVIGIECRGADARTLELVSVLNHRDTRIAMDAERAFAHRLGGSCQSPIAAHARIGGRRLILDGLVAEPDGSRLLRDTLPGSVDDPAALGRRLAERLLAAGAGPLLERLRAG